MEVFGIVNYFYELKGKIPQVLKVPEVTIGKNCGNEVTR